MEISNNNLYAGYFSAMMKNKFWLLWHNIESIRCLTLSVDYDSGDITGFKQWCVL